jgi:DNA-binding NtrC family response regulator
MTASSTHITWRPQLVPAGGPHLIRILDPRRPARGCSLEPLHGDRAAAECIELTREPRGWILHAAPGRSLPRVGGVPTRSRRLCDRDVITTDGAAYIFRSDLRPTSARRLGALATLHPQLSVTYEALDRLARSNIPIVITGETGTGKELTARAVHDGSGRPGNFIAVNCGALPASLVESELFGCARGAFSGADTDRLGLVRAANGGTLFLDEIAELSVLSQVALLRVLQEGIVRPLGSTRECRVDIRVVSATHQDLAARVADGRFREDLYARLAGYTAHLPPLRDRFDDLGLVIGELVHKLAPEPAAAVAFEPAAARALVAYDWPRNIRELENALRTAIVLAGDAPITLEHLPPAVRAAIREPTARLSPIERDQRDRVRTAIAGSRGNVTVAARTLGCSRQHAHRLLTKYAIVAADFR